MLACVIDAVLAEQTFQQADRLLEPAHAQRWCVVRDAELLVVGRAPSGTDTDLDPTLREDVERRDLFREHHRIAEIVREHDAADAQTRRGIGRGHQRWYGCELLAHVVGHEEHVITQILGAARDVAPMSAAAGPAHS